MTASRRRVGQDRGTPLDFDDFFRDEFERLFHTLLLVVGNPTEAEEIAQEAMARVFERWERVQAMDSPTGYLYRTAFNLHGTLIRRLALAARKRLGLMPPEDPSQLDQVERRLEARLAIRALPRTQRETLVLIEWVGLSAEEAAQVLGIDPSSVRGRIHRARKTLAERLGGTDE